MEKRSFDVIATVGPNVCHKDSLLGFLERGVTIFRINGSHTTKKSAREMLRLIRKVTKKHVKILIDLPGNKVRIIGLHRPIKLEAQKAFLLKRNQFNFPEFVNFITKDHLLLARDSMIQLQLGSVSRSHVELIPLTRGLLTNGAGINVRGQHPNIAYLHERDYELIRLAKEESIDYIGFSYVRDCSHINQAKDLLTGSNIQPIFKIETSEACEQLDQILPLVDTILIDRGDLSSEVGIHEVPYQIENIIQKANNFGNKVYVATQFLHYMNEYPIPSISEIIVLHDMISKVDGLQLSEETATGKYPFQALEMIQQSRLAVHGRKHDADFMRRVSVV